LQITVDEQAQRFHLALDEWVGVVGHKIIVGKYQFCAIPLPNRINVSEITTGARLFSIPVDLAVDIMTETKEGMIQYLYMVGESIKRTIDKQNDFDGMLADIKKQAFERLGEMPPIEDIDESLIIAPFRGIS